MARITSNEVSASWSSFYTSISVLHFHAFHKALAPVYQRHTRIFFSLKVHMATSILLSRVPQLLSGLSGFLARVLIGNNHVESYYMTWKYYFIPGIIFVFCKKDKIIGTYPVHFLCWGEKSNSSWFVAFYQILTLGYTLERMNKDPQYFSIVY